MDNDARLHTARPGEVDPLAVVAYLFGLAGIACWTRIEAAHLLALIARRLERAHTREKGSALQDIKQLASQFRLWARRAEASPHEEALAPFLIQRELECEGSRGAIAYRPVAPMRPARVVLMLKQGVVYRGDVDSSFPIELAVLEDDDASRSAGPVAEYVRAYEPEPVTMTADLDAVFRAIVPVATIAET